MLPPTIVAVDGPEVCVQVYEVIVPLGSDDPLPFNEVLLVGKVIVWLEPALATGGLFTAAFTVMVTVSASVAPPLSFTVSANKYVP